MGFWIVLACIVALFAVIGLAVWARSSPREHTEAEQEWDAAIK